MHTLNDILPPPPQQQQQHNNTPTTTHQQSFINLNYEIMRGKSYPYSRINVAEWIETVTKEESAGADDLLWDDEAHFR